MTRLNQVDHIRLTSHPEPGGKLQFPITWGAATARERGPIIGTVSRAQHRNVIGTHGGSYAVYRALAVSSGALDPIRRSDLTNTYPAATIGPFPQWSDPERIVSLDPWGHLIAENFTAERLPKFLGYFEQILARDRGRFLVGNTPSYVDLSLFQVIDGLRYAFPRSMAKQEPNHRRAIALRDRVALRPRLAAYLASERRLPFNQQGIFRHYPELDAGS